MRRSRALALIMGASLLAGTAYAQETISDLPRNQTLIAENPEGTVKNASWFNLWIVERTARSQQGLVARIDCGNL